MNERGTWAILICMAVIYMAVSASGINISEGDGLPVFSWQWFAMIAFLALAIWAMRRETKR